MCTAGVPTKRVAKIRQIQESRWQCLGLETAAQESRPSLEPKEALRQSYGLSVFIDGPQGHCAIISGRKQDYNNERWGGPRQTRWKHRGQHRNRELPRPCEGQVLQGHMRESPNAQDTTTPNSHLLLPGKEPNGLVSFEISSPSADSATPQRSRASTCPHWATPRMRASPEYQPLSSDWEKKQQSGPARFYTRPVASHTVAWATSKIPGNSGSPASRPPDVSPRSRFLIQASGLGSSHPEGAGLS